MKTWRLAILAAAGLAASVATAQEVGGKYRVTGTNLDGSHYSGTAEIVVTSPTTCRIAWVTGGTTSRGICMRRSNVFTAAYKLGNAVGLVIYEVKDNGVLDGIWTVADQRGAGTDVLTPVR
ncbi:MAG TPA: hypothetical protein VGG01_07720 [Xanthobacteraceae bacterium]